MSTIWEFLEQRKITKTVSTKKVLPGSTGATGPTVYFDNEEPAYEAVLKFRGMSESEIVTQETQVNTRNTTFPWVMTYTGFLVTGFPISVVSDRIAGVVYDSSVLFSGTVTVLRTDVRSIE